MKILVLSRPCWEDNFEPAAATQKMSEAKDSVQGYKDSVMGIRTLKICQVSEDLLKEMS